MFPTQQSVEQKRNSFEPLLIHRTHRNDCAHHPLNAFCKSHIVKFAYLKLSVGAVSSAGSAFGGQLHRVSYNEWTFQQHLRRGAFGCGLLFTSDVEFRQQILDSPDAHFIVWQLHRR